MFRISKNLYTLLFFVLPFTTNTFVSAFLNQPLEGEFHTLKVAPNTRLYAFNEDNQSRKNQDYTLNIGKTLDILDFVRLQYLLLCHHGLCNNLHNFLEPTSPSYKLHMIINDKYCPCLLQWTSLSVLLSSFSEVSFFCLFFLVQILLAREFP